MYHAIGKDTLPRATLLNQQIRQFQKEPRLVKNNLDEVRQGSDKFRKNPGWSKNNPDEVRQNYR